jgi:hypothetical protein
MSSVFEVEKVWMKGEHHEEESFISFVATPLRLAHIDGFRLAFDGDADTETNISTFLTPSKSDSHPILRGSDFLSAGSL